MSFADFSTSEKSISKILGFEKSDRKHQTIAKFLAQGLYPVF